MALEDFIQDFAKALEADGENNAPASRSTPRVPDPLLERLLRDYCHARTNHEKAVREYGADSPMAILAADMKATAKACVETRLSELPLEVLQSLSQIPEKAPELKTKLAYAKTLKQRRREEEEKAARRAREEKERNSSIANDIFLAFLLMALFTGRFGRKDILVPCFDFSQSFAEAAGTR